MCEPFCWCAPFRFFSSSSCCPFCSSVAFVRISLGPRQSVSVAPHRTMHVKRYIPSDRRFYYSTMGHGNGHPASTAANVVKHTHTHICIQLPACYLLLFCAEYTNFIAHFGVDGVCVCVCLCVRSASRICGTQAMDPAQSNDDHSHMNCNEFQKINYMEMVDSGELYDAGSSRRQGTKQHISSRSRAYSKCLFMLPFHTTCVHILRYSFILLSSPRQYLLRLIFIGTE